VREIFFAHTHMSFIRKAPHEWDTYTYAPYTLMARTIFTHTITLDR